MAGENKRGFFRSARKFLHDNIYINKVPSYGNTIFYSFGFILMTCFLLLAVTGVLMVFFSKPWWLTSLFGIYVRSVHMWAAQAFMLFLVLHLFVTFSTSAFRKKKLPWVIGSIMLFLIAIQTELGYTLRGDFSSQWRALQGADFWNGIHLGSFFNMLDYKQVFGVHILLIPLLLLLLVGLHYGIVRHRGISKPYRKDIKFKMVEANHKTLYLRASIVVAAILVLAFFIQSPFLPAVTAQQVSQQQPSVFAQTLIAEFNHTSDTATYLDSIDPYRFDTREVYVVQPYASYLSVNPGKNELTALDSESSAVQMKTLNEADNYFANNGSPDVSNSNPLVSVASSLTIMAQSGLYDSQLKNDLQGDNPTYIYRFLSDTGYLDEKAGNLGLSLENYGMIKDEKGAGILPPNSWWMAPYNLLDNTLLKNDPNADSDGGMILGLVILLLATLPWLPYVNRIPDKLRFYKIFWRMKDRKRA